MADNLKIIYTNSIDDAATITATSEATGFDIENVQTDAKIKTWRSTSLSAQTLTFTWSTGQSIGGVALAFTNLILNSTIRIKCYTLAADVSAAYDSGVKTLSFVYPPPAGFSTNNSTSFAYGGGNHWSWFFTQASFEKLEIIINSAGNPDNYMEVSRVIAGAVWSPVYNAMMNFPVSWDDLTSSVRLESGDHVAERNPISRSMNINLAAMRQADKQTLSTIIRRNGASEPIFVNAMPQASVAEDESHLQIYGRLNNEFSINMFGVDLYESQLSVIEI